MSLDLNFVYYRNFRFDGKFHLRCQGDDLTKVARIRYELRRISATGSIDLGGVSSRSHARTGSLSDQGCPATLLTVSRSGRFEITPKVYLLAPQGQARDRSAGADQAIVMPTLVIDIQDGEAQRSILDKVPLGYTPTRVRREVVEQGAAPQVIDPWGARQAQLPRPAEGERYPPMLVRFRKGGLQALLADLKPESGSSLAGRWPELADHLALQPLLDAQEQQDPQLAALRPYCQLEQPAGMSNARYREWLGTLSALEQVESLHLSSLQLADPNVFAAGAAAVLATLLTGAAVAAGDRAYEDAQPTPDFESQQKYLDGAEANTKGLNVRKAWAKNVKGQGVRIHFSDGGLFPDHEDLQGDPKLKVIVATPNNNPKHGTASAGVLVAAKNGFGVTGVSHASELFLYDNNAFNAYRDSLTLKAMLRHVQPGDIVGVNRQTANIEVLSTFLPSLHERQWWDAMQALSQRGAVVLNAACNGSNATLSDKGTVQSYGVDLSHWPYFEDHGDAGCIVVGASHSWDGKPHQYSNYKYPYRMLNAWGDSVTTLSYGDLQDKQGEDRDYTASYSGTSSATPLVTGALALIQSYAIEQHHLYLDGNQMHLLVMASGHGDASLPHDPVLPMGKRPDVYAALVLLDEIVGGGRFTQGKDEL